MSIINQKGNIFGEINAKKTLLDGMPSLQLNPSFPSINNDTNPLNFLTDLLSSLVGVESLKEVIIDTLTRNLPNIEVEIKQSIKKSLNNLVSCQINPSIPSYLIGDGKGIDLELKKIDFLNLMLTNPDSGIGELLYDDIESGLHSKDFNIFLYNVIQDGGTHTWADCIDVTFIESGSVNNVVNIKVNDSFISGGKTLKDLNNVLVDSVDLFDIADVLNKLLDNVFGVITKEQGKSKEQVLSEMKINKIIDSIMNQEDGEVIDDSFFEFDNDTLKELEIGAENRIKGVKVVNTSIQYDTSANINTLLQNTQDIKNNPESLEEVLSSALNKISDDITAQIPEIDKYSVKLDFISDLVKNLMRVIANIIISPKIITIFSINHKIIYGEVFDDIIGFIAENKYLIQTIFNEIRDIVMDVLLKIVLKEVQQLVLRSSVEIQAEQIKNTSAIINSLVGVPLEVTRQISGINKGF
jgi:hypothetical protein